MTLFFKRRDLPFKRDSQGFLVVNSKSGTFSRLEGVSATVWNNLKNPKAKQELIKLICSEYEVDKKTASTDLEEFLNQAIKAGFIEKIEK